MEAPSSDQVQEVTPEQEAAAEAVMEYFRLNEETLMDLGADLQPLVNITDGNMRRMTMEIVAAYRANKLLHQGHASYTLLRVHTPVSDGNEVQIGVVACADGREIDVIEADSKLPAEGSSVPFLNYEFLTAERHGRWVVIDGRNVEVGSCS